jgi:hypothetical protein
VFGSGTFLSSLVILSSTAKLALKTISVGGNCAQPAASPASRYRLWREAWVTAVSPE